jgi:hypothetical protein
MFYYGELQTCKAEVAQYAVFSVDVHVSRTVEGLQNNRCDITKVVCIVNNGQRVCFSNDTTNK